MQRRSNIHTSDEEYMRRALVLAARAKGRTSPNPMVGAVVVKSGKIIAEGWHIRCGTDHAEVVALRKSGRRARGAKLYVNLEPCCHYGRTPPCVDRIIDSGIEEVIIAMKDPNPLVNGKSIRILRKAGIVTKVGILRKEAEELNEAFIKYIKEKMPFVVAKCAQSLDGKIATATGMSKWITSEKTRLFSRKKRDEFDAILVGINTVIKDNPILSGAKRYDIKRIIVDTNLRIPLNSRILKEPICKYCIIATTSKAPSNKIEQLRKKGITVIVSHEGGVGVDLAWLFRKIASLGIINILIEGGAKVIGSALRYGLVDKMHIYIAPKIIGSQYALSSVDGLDTRDVNKAVRLKGLDLTRIGDDIFISGYVFRNS